MTVGEISPQQLKRRLEAGEKPCVLDVREPWEVAIVSLPGSVNIPLHEIPLRLKELDAGSEIIVMCKMGGRSRQAAEFLAAHNFSRVSNLTGGIVAWGREVDPALPDY
ncbi:MAG TPA: rhodanese-like domain-containing protein [Steroidobacteraceae bacterium]|nr:rhodanese-like domain-containing protein [Steroidobacteraceae bacterium]